MAVRLRPQRARYVLNETDLSSIKPTLEKTVKCALIVNTLFALGLLLG